MQNLMPVNNVFSGGKIIHFTQTKHPGILWASYKRKKNCYVVFQPISQLQYWAKTNGSRPVISFPLSALCSPEAAQSLFQMDQQTVIDLSPCLHFHPLAHLSVHLFTPALQRAAFSTEKRLKEQKRKRKRGRVFGAEQSLIPLTQKLTLIPGTQWSQPPAPLGRAANNTHNAACLWLPESPVAILVQLVEGRARDVMPGSSL